jgi:hypothetical protein
MGRSQPVCRLLLTAAARVHAHFRSHGICGGYNGIGTGLTQSPLVFTCHYHSTQAPYFLVHRLEDGQGTC